MLTAGVVALAVLAAIASPVFAVFAVFFAVFAFLFDYSAVRSWGDFTQVRPDGIRTRRRGRVYDWPWAEVADISQDWVNGKAGATRFVVLTTTADEEFRLGAPMLFGAKRRSADLFLEQFGRITAAWKSATGAASPRANGLTASDQGLTGPGRFRTGTFRRTGLPKSKTLSETQAERLPICHISGIQGSLAWMPTTSKSQPR